MEKSQKSRKPLIIGILAAVIVLGTLLALLLTQCTGGAQTATTGATVSTEEGAATYELYWNADRDQYAGKSEAGMSARTMADDGYFYIRFILDGKEVTLKTADRKLVNAIDVRDLMGLEFDENGVITGVVDLEDMPLEQVAWQFYVQSVGGNLIKLNSSKTFVGMEILLECGELTRIYDMTGLEGPVGTEVVPATYDRVIAIANLAGELTHVFLCDRSDFMLTHEAECQHCKETVTWYEWTKTDSLPKEPGHYQLMNDITVTGQLSMASEVKICLDLNGHRVDGKQDVRIISLHNAGCELALMDTSAEKTGRMVGHSTASPQGGIVWVRYGAFYMYGGTLDGSDMTSRLNGTVVEVPKNAFFYMYDGEIIGGTAAPQYNEETGKYGYGLGGSLSLSGTMRMYGGKISGGKSPAAYYYNNKGKLTVARGMGGNIFMASGSVLELHDGQILGGYAGNVGGNIMMDGTAELIIHGGTVSGGWTNSRVAGKNGANIYCPAKATIEMDGGSISGGNNVTAGGGNLYLTGTMNMTGGSVTGGKAKTSGGNIQVSGSGKLNLYAGYIGGGSCEGSGGNIALYSKASLNMLGGTLTGGTAGVSGGNIIAGSSGKTTISGGTITGGIAKGEAAGTGGGNIAVTANAAIVNITGGTVSKGVSAGLVAEDGTLTGGDGGNININKGTVSITGGTVTGGNAQGNGDGIYVGWNSVSLTVGKTARIYGNEGVDICRSANTAEGKSRILLENWEGNGTEAALVIQRLNAVAGTLLASPAGDTVLAETDAAKFASAKKVLPVTLGKEGDLILGEAYLGEGDHKHCLCGGKLTGHSCSDTGFVSVNAEEFLDCFILDGSTYKLAGSLSLCLTEDVTLDAEFALSGYSLDLCLHGHTVTTEGKGRISANGKTGLLNLADCTETGKIVAAKDCRSSILYTYKGAVNVYGGTVDASRCAEGAGGVVRVGYDGDSFTLYGGTLIGSKRATIGGTIYCGVEGTVNIHGGTVRDGVANNGGNILMNKGALNITGGTVSGGESIGTTGGYGGGNININHDACKLTVSGDAVISGGKSAANGGNINLNRGTVVLSGGTVTGGSATGNGGGLYLGYNALALELSGEAKLCDNTASDIFLGSKSSNLVTLKAWKGNGTDNALVIGKLDGVSGAVLVKAPDKDQLEESAAEMFASADKRMRVYCFGGKLVLYPVLGEGSHSHCLCTGKLEGHSCEEVAYVPVTGDQLKALWLKNGSANVLGADANLCLTEDVTLSAEYPVSGHTLNLCLHGHTVTMEGKARITANGGTGLFNLSDCKDSGKILASQDCRSSILYTYKGDLNIYGGTVDAALCAAGNGGAVNVGMEGDSLSVYGGTLIGSKNAGDGGAVYCGVKAEVNICGGTVRDGVAANGGNIFMNNGVLNISGGTISGGEATGTEAGFGGGNIQLNKDNVVLNISGGTVSGGKSATNGGNINANRGKVTVSGGIVTGGTAAGNGGGIYMGHFASLLSLSGDAKLYGNGSGDIFLGGNSTDILTLGSWAGNDDQAALRIGKLNGAVGSVLAKAEGEGTLDASSAALFAAEDETMSILPYGGKLVLYTAFGEADHMHCVCGGSLAGHTCADTAYIPVTAEQFLGAWLPAGGNKSLAKNLNLCLTEDVSLNAEHVVAGNTLNLCLHGHTITMEGKGRLNANGTTGILNITDCQETGKILASQDCRAGILYTYKGALNIYGGTVDATACASGNGGAVNVGYEGDTFTLYGGKLIGNKNSVSGGAVYCGPEATVNILGGIITGGAASENGGNICMNRGKLFISGGTVTGGSATTNGGGIYFGYNATEFVLSGNALIYGNEVSDIYFGSKPENVLTLKDWAGNGDKGAAKIGKLNGTNGAVLVQAVEEGALEQASVELFLSSDPAKILVLRNGKLALYPAVSTGEHMHCVCNGAVDHAHNESAFSDVTAEEFRSLWLSSGEVYELGKDQDLRLTEDVTLNAEYVLAGHTLNLCLNGHTITMEGNGRITANGGSGQLNLTDCDGNGKILAAGDCRSSILFTYKGAVNIYGGTVDAAACASGNGGAITVGYTGDSLNVYGGTLVGSQSANNGGAIYCAVQAAVNIHGGTVVGGKAVYGGAIYCGAKAVLNIYNGTVKDGVAESGGNIFIGSGELNLLGGTVSGGESTGTTAGFGGGNIQMDNNAGVMNISGGTVSGGKSATNGGNVNVNKGKASISGGTITGGAASANGGGVYMGYNVTDLELSGSAKIYGNTGSDIFLGSNTANRITLKNWAGNGDKGAAVLGKLDGKVGDVLAAPATDADATLFTGTDVTKSILCYENKLILYPAITAGDHNHCVCGNEVDHSHSNVGFMAVTAEQFQAFWLEKDGACVLATDLNLCLTEDVTLTGAYQLSGKTLNLCLNGKTVFLEGTSGFKTDGEMNITDCAGNGIIKALDESNSGFLRVEDGALNLYAGTVDASAVKLPVTDKTKDGGAIHVYGTNDLFTMYGGTVIGGQIYRGGAIYAYKGGIVIRGGLVTGGSADIGGNVAVNYGTFEMHGGEITNGTATGNGAGVSIGYQAATAPVISGNARICGNTGAADIHLGQKTSRNVNYITLNNWNGNGSGVAAMTVTQADGSQTTVAKAAEGQSLVYTDKTKLAAFDAAKQVIFNGTDLELVAAGHYHCCCGGALEGAADHACKDILFTEAASLDTLTADANLYVGEGFTLDKEIKTAGFTLNLCLNGQTLTTGDNGRFTANGGGTLNIADCGTNGSVEAGSATRRQVIYSHQGAINLFGGTLNGKAINTTGSAGMVYVNQADASFTMYGGKIIGATKITDGGAVYVNDGSFTMLDGIIENGHASGNGGNILNNKGVVHILGGTVTGGTCDGISDGIYMAWSAKELTISGSAKIYGNGTVDVARNNNTAEVTRIYLDGWQGNGTYGKLKLARVDNVDGKVIVNGTGLTEAVLDQVTYYDSKYALELADGKLVLDELHAHCICAGNQEHTHTTTDFKTVDAAQFHSYFGSDGMLDASASLCLMENVEMSAEYALAGNTLNLCLNGKTVTLKNNGRFKSDSNAVLNITDCGTDGKLAAEEDNVNALLYANGGDINFYAGTLNAEKVVSTGTTAYDFGAAVNVYTDNDYFTMYGGTIIGGTAGRGGSIYSQKGHVVIYAGTIRGGNATLGGNIHMNYGSFAMYGGTVTGGTVSGTNATGAGVNIGHNVTAPVILSGNARIYGNTGGADLHLGQNKDTAGNFVTLKSWNGNGDGIASMTVTQVAGTKTTVIAKAEQGSLAYTDKAKLTAFDGAQQVIFNGADLELVAAGHYHCVCGGALQGTDGHICKDILYTEAASLEALTDDANLYIGSDLTLAKEIGASGYTMNLCLNGRTLKMSGGRITANGTTGVVNITDCSPEDTGKIEAQENAACAFLYTYKGSMNLYDGTIDATKAVKDTKGGTQGGAIYVNQANDVFTMYGGHIIGSTTGVITAGGAICSKATVNILDGTITGGKATNGGAVYCNGGSFEISGGTITSGIATASGGNVFVNTGSFTVSGDALITAGTSQGATAGNGGGNIQLNTASAKFFVEGGTVQNGVSDLAGGNININKGEAYISGGLVTGGTGTNGNGVYLGWTDTNVLQISGNAKIQGNNTNDIAISFNKNNFVELSGWAGNDSGKELKIALVDPTKASAILAADKDGNALTDAELARFVSGNAGYSLVLNSAGQIVVKAN